MSAPVVIGDATLHCGDCREVLRTLADCSIDSVVCDPPYELTGARPGGRSDAARGAVMGGFMGLKWDASGIAHDVQMWAECLRVLKPGGHLLAFSGARTYHRMACAIEDAGFELRDQIMWLYGSGFPKSLDVSKAIDKAAGAEREVVGMKSVGNGNRKGDGFRHAGDSSGIPVTVPTSEPAREWEGWGTALKPAHEPICVARKPFAGTVAGNVLEHGTGALNIDACRVEHQTINGGNLADNPHLRGTKLRAAPVSTMFGRAGDETPLTSPAGRWPANVIHDGSPEVLAAFPDAPGQMADAKTSAERKTANVYGVMRYAEPSSDRTYASVGGTNFSMKPGARRLDTGSAARFFYCAKASRTDRNEGCDHMQRKPLHWSSGEANPGSFQSDGTDRTSPNNHPTVKPTELMAYLCRLVTAPGGVVLDPFMGSGSTGKAAVREGFRFVGIDLTPEYVEIARARIEFEIARIASDTARMERLRAEIERQPDFFQDVA